MPQPPVTLSPTLYMEDDSQWLIENLQPIPQANHIRQQILDFLNQLIRPKISNEEVQLFICGSTCSRTYLPDSDIDLTLITPSHGTVDGTTAGTSHHHMKYLIDLSTTFIEEIYRRDRDRDANSETSWKLSSASGESIEQDFPIRNVEFINARVKLLHCVVRNVGIDITVNQRGAIGSLLFIEEADKVVGCDHLLKKSIVLIKAWCLYESTSICGVPIIGAKDGMFSSYALTVMVLHLFNRYGNSLRSPFAVLRMFFYFYHGFPWETSVLTLEGPKPIQSGGSTGLLTKELQGKYQLCNNQFKHITSSQRFQRHKQQHSKEVPSSSGATSTTHLPPLGVNRFPIRACNIQDPVDETNNLGVSVSRNNLQIIDKALYYGYNRMEHAVSVMGQVLSMYHGSGGSAANASSSSATNSNLNVITTSLDLTNSAAIGSGPNPSMQSNYLQASIASGRSSPSSSVTSATPTDPQRRGSKRGTQGSGPSAPTFVFPPVGGAVSQLFPTIGESSIIGQPMDPSISAGMQPPSAPLPTPVSAHFPGYHQSYQSSGITAPSSSTSGVILPRGLFVRELFPVSMMKYIVTGPGIQRPDLLLHPLQKGPVKSFHESQKGVSNNQQSSNTDDNSGTQMDPFESNIEELVDALLTQRPSNPPSPPSELNNKVAEEQPVTDQNDAPNKDRKEETIHNSGEETKSDRDLLESVIKEDGTKVEKIAPAANNSNSVSSGFNAITSKSKKRKDREKEKAKERFAVKKNDASPTLEDLYLTVGQGSLETPEDYERDSSEQSDNIITNNTSTKLDERKYHSDFNDDLHKETSPSRKTRGVWQWSIFFLMSMGVVFIAITFTAPLPNSDSDILTRFQLGSQYYWFSFMQNVCGNGNGSGIDRNHDTLPYNGVRSVSVVTPSAAPTQQACGESNTSRFDSLTHLITHWVQLGDTVTFGDFSGSSISSTNSLANVHQNGMEQPAVYVWQKDFQYLTTTQVPYFTIVNSRFEDAGHYRCLKMIGSTSFLVTETIIRISRKPTVKSSPFFTELKQGSSFLFELDFEGFPKPMFQWYKNGYKMEGQNSNALQLAEVDSSHTGTYSCELSNIAGSILWLEGSLLVAE